VSHITTNDVQNTAIDTLMLQHDLKNNIHEQSDLATQFSTG